MPYIHPEDRKLLDDRIDALVESLHDGWSLHMSAGRLNYVITTLILKVLHAKTSKPNYHGIALVTGVLENIKQEFYRRYAANYEDGAAKRNGDIPGYEEMGEP